MVTVGAEVYPEPPTKPVNPVTIPPETVAVALAPVPPPPEKITVGADR